MSLHDPGQSFKDHEPGEFLSHDPGEALMHDPGDAISSHDENGGMCFSHDESAG